ncbi:MAG: hypothetical protein OEQ53_07700, partial [Saprospiraceae bacterium]|nr:hypothetical protein [Saprospiraceae bacterium]
LAVAAETAGKLYEINIQGATVAIQGFGAVGKHAARFLQERGATLISAADSTGTITNTEGLNIEQLIKIKEDGGSVIDYADGEKGNSEAVISVACDIWIPAARPDVIREDNVSQVRTKLIVQGANIPITHEAEQVLFQQGVHVIPDFIANAGGVICAAVEYHEGTETSALEIIKEKIELNTKVVIAQSKTDNIPPRQAANRLALDRVKKAMEYQKK